MACALVWENSFNTNHQCCVAQVDDYTQGYQTKRMLSNTTFCLYHFVRDRGFLSLWNSFIDANSALAPMIELLPPYSPPTLLPPLSFLSAPPFNPFLSQVVRVQCPTSHVGGHGAERPLVEEEAVGTLRPTPRVIVSSIFKASQAHAVRARRGRARERGGAPA